MWSRWAQTLAESFLEQHSSPSGQHCGGASSGTAEEILLGFSSYFASSRGSWCSLVSLWSCFSPISPESCYSQFSLEICKFTSNWKRCYFLFTLESSSSPASSESFCYPSFLERCCSSSILESCCPPLASWVSSPPWPGSQSWSSSQQEAPTTLRGSIICNLNFYHFQNIFIKKYSVKKEMSLSSLR